MTVFLATLLIVAVGQAAPIAVDYGRAPVIQQHNFELASDANYDGWPDHWTRRQGQGFPTYVPIEIVDDPADSANRVLRIRLDGGAGAASSPPVAVHGHASYVVEGRAKTENLRHDRAFISVTFHDEKGRALATHYSDRLTTQPDWRALRIGPLAPPPETRLATVTVHLEPTDAEDLEGSAWFDDIRLARLPRVEIATDAPYNLITLGESLSIDCSVAGYLDEAPTITYTLEDVWGRRLEEARPPLVEVRDIHLEPWTDPAVVVAESMVRLAEAHWTPNIQQAGFYRLRVRLASSLQAAPEQVLTLAVLPPGAAPNASEFGWTLARGDDPVALEDLPDMLGRIGVRRVKFPVWFDPNDAARADALSRFVDQLSARGVELIGLLNHPPASTADPAGVPRTTAASLFSDDPTTWSASLQEVLTRLGLKIRRWQLGDDDDSSLAGYADAPLRVARVKTEMDRIAQDVDLGVGWSWLEEPPGGGPMPWRFLVMSADPPLSAAETSEYLQAADRRAAIWMTLAPLERGRYSQAARGDDLVRRMMAAKIHGAAAIDIPEPFSTARGVMNDDGSPGELLVPWRTATAVLAGAEYIGSIVLPSGSENHIFARGGAATMFVWADSPRGEVLYLGEDVRQQDVWGASRPAPREEEGQAVEVDRRLALVSGLNESIARWRKSTVLDADKIPATFDGPHTNGVSFQNPFPDGVSGEVRVVGPDDWTITPQRIPFQLAAGETRREPFDIVLDLNADSGPRSVRLEFDIVADRRYQFTAFREVEVGLGDVTLTGGSWLNARGELIVEQRLTNHGDREVAFRCHLFAPGERRLTQRIERLTRGTDVKTYLLTDGLPLIGQTITLRAEEVGGARVLNYRFPAAQ